MIRNDVTKIINLIREDCFTAIKALVGIDETLLLIRETVGTATMIV